MMRRLIVVGIVAVVGLPLLFGVFLYHYPKDLGDGTVTVIIGQGDGFQQVAANLQGQGAIRSQAVLKLMARWRGVDTKLVPGRYDFTGRVSTDGILDRLAAGDFLRLRLTLWEGAPIWSAAGEIARRLELDSAEIQALNTDSVLCARLGVPQLEGYLFPETYFIPWGTPVREVLQLLVETHFQMTDTVWPEVIPNDLSKSEILTLASIIEAEAFLNDEMPTISSVYHNRLEKNWRLDADPTVIYGMGGLDRPLTRPDLRKDTPYNTYRRRGLPPTPINSPGLAAIRAALYPAETDYFFFVADGSGRHRFSRTNAEHNRARMEIKNHLKENDQ
jgi:UPF0755 protein